jgi:UDP-N-acetylglucosamine--N-acetylmuramyl-(pentapeptide) pyrophosphoryl-undecaprenol N-acetylglucosamine transferase
MRIVLTGGGSGGHIYPLLAVLQEIKEQLKPRNITPEFIYMGPADSYSAVLQSVDVQFRAIAGPKLRRYASFGNLLDIPKFFVALIEAWWKLFLIMPDVVFSKGGPGALPVVLLAWFYRIPVVVHESDIAPGLTNLLSRPFARRVCVTFEEALPYFGKKGVLTGNPVRIALRAPQVAKETGKKELGFSPGEPLVVILGGSQGSQRINEFIALNLKELIGMTQVLHQCGTANQGYMEKLTKAALAESSAVTKATRYRLAPYLEDREMSVALGAADVIVTRAGSGTIAELALYGKPVILIPLASSANDHQRANAYAFAKQGAAIVIEEPNLQFGIFVGQLKTVLQGGEFADNMGAAMRRLAKPDAARAVAVEVLSSSPTGTV